MNDSAISLADARPLVASPLWPRIRAFLWNFASLCDPARLTAAFEAPSSDGEEQAEEAGDPLVTRHSSLPAAVLAAGHRLLALALSDLPPELLLRQRLRFPAGSPADAALAREAGSVPEASASGAALAAAKLALKLSNPQEYTTCFS